MHTVARAWIPAANGCRWWLIALLVAGLCTGALATTYEYDGVNRLAKVVYGDGSTIIYEYDAVGNRTVRIMNTNSATVCMAVSVDPAASGKVLRQPDMNCFAAGTVNQLTPVPAGACSFLRWGGDVPAGHEIDNPLTISPNDYSTIVAYFQPSWSTSEWDCNNNGTYDGCEAEVDCNGNGVLDACDGYVCSDGNPCTDDSCGGTSCSSMNNAAFCDDGQMCTISDVCFGGACGGVYQCWLYGETVPSCDVDVDDLICLLAGFANFVDCVRADIHPCDGANLVIDLDDLIALLGAFAGEDPPPGCSHPCPP